MRREGWQGEAHGLLNATHMAHQVGMPVKHLKMAKSYKRQWVNGSDKSLSPHRYNERTPLPREWLAAIETAGRPIVPPIEKRS
jgi:hypothetical protein